MRSISSPLLVLERLHDLVVDDRPVLELAELRVADRPAVGHGEVQVELSVKAAELEPTLDASSTAATDRVGEEVCAN